MDLRTDLKMLFRDDDSNSVHSMDDDLESVDSGSTSSPASGKGRVVTGRGITLSTLMNDGIVEAGENVLTVDYLGRNFTADLCKDGKICWTHKNTKEIFNSPSAWAIHIKKLVNPAKKSGCGWASVKYKGKKLDLWKSVWFRKMKLGLPTPELNGNGNHSDGLHLLDEMMQNGGSKESEDFQDLPSPTDRPRAPVSELTRKKSSSSCNRKMGEEEYTQGMMCGSMTKSDQREFQVVKYSSLGKRSSERDHSKLVECLSFSSQGRIQPFTVSITTNCLLVVDFHCHLTTSEVVGYLAGKWDSSTQHMSVLQAFPCRCRLGDKQNAAVVEEEIRRSIALRGLQLIGWYHSHPCSAAQPSLADVECQMEYQIQMKGEGNSYQPCLALVCCPYTLQRPQKESSLKSYWVMPPPECQANRFGVPMTMNFNWQSDIFLTQDVLLEMKCLAEYYKDSADLVWFKETWHKSETFMDKLKGSLSKKFPKDQTDGRLLDYIHNLLL
ncbi:MPN domain-containing protein-like [Amphiura filiformis]|uniref:MPN domain-containing protein-like n=1 Tax=Amphiura filiformis TaxID=82378 RepID=UPI003B220685